MSAKKKFKLSLSPKGSKRAIEAPELPRKRLKFDSNEEDEIEAKKKKNFKTACELVSRKNYFDYRKRFLLVYLPTCLSATCKHHNKSEEDIKHTPYYADEAMKTEMRNNMWYEALEVCQLSLTSSRYLSSDVLQEIVEIIMNAQEDEYSEHPVKHIVDRSQQILMQNFSTHPPCLARNLRNCYNSFLTSPLDLRTNTFSNRKKYEHNKGIVKYCMNRLEYELTADSIDGPLINKHEMMPEEMKDSVQGVHWLKNKLDIFEALNRKERIERLFVVLETVVELLQFDLAIWHSRLVYKRSGTTQPSHHEIF
ncbi:uncharacterized protein LOC142973382 isoform X2 [Anticarsia gemmatalis]|uniref:uncharacterized protein LOC142973382 isoform X2 n=1 Tax=Anticarsia gemmatalis TaxID=129554 RepID=UPI003F76C195